MGFWDIFDPEEISGSPTRQRRSVGRNPVSLRDSGFLDALERISGEMSGGYPGRWRTPIGANASFRAGSGTPWGRTRSLGREPIRPPGINDILARLEALQDPSRYLGNEDDIRDQAMSAASSQYDPLIAALRSQMGSAQNRANRNYGQLGQMYSALSGDIQGDIPEIQQMYTEDKAESRAGFDQLQAGIKDQYAQSAAEQEAMLQRLNIEAAAPDILPEQQRDRDYFTQLAARDAQTEQSALGTEERGAVDYTRSGSQIARYEGTNRQANLMSELADLLAQYEGQIGSQQAAKQSAFQAAMGELQSNRASDATSMAQRDFDNYIRMIQLGRDLKGDEGTSTAPKSVKSPADVAGRAIGMGLDQKGAQTIQDVFMSAISSDPVILAGVNPMSGQSVPKEALALRIIEAGRKAGLGRAQLNALQTIALEYFGRS